jgi:hypothetical protein
VPDSWWEFDVWRATRTGDLARLIDAQIAQNPDLGPRRSALLKAIRLAADRAERQGAVFCAVMGELVEDAGMLAASLMVFHTDGSPDPAENTVAAIAGQLTAVAPSPGSVDWRRVEVVDLPTAGPAVRVTGVEHAELDGAGPVLCVISQTLLPVPDGTGVLNVVLTSPQVEIAEAMADLFDAISSTLTWTDTDTDTT